MHFFCNIMDIADIWSFVRIRVDTLRYQLPQTFTVLVRGQGRIVALKKECQWVQWNLNIPAILPALFSCTRSRGSFYLHKTETEAQPFHTEDILRTRCPTWSCIRARVSSLATCSRGSQPGSGPLSSWKRRTDLSQGLLALQLPRQWWTHWLA